MDLRGKGGEEEPETGSERGQRKKRKEKEWEV